MGGLLPGGDEGTGGKESSTVGVRTAFLPRREAMKSRARLDEEREGDRVERGVVSGDRRLCEEGALTEELLPGEGVLLAEAEARELERVGILGGVPAGSRAARTP
jgi:hypothetical protein